MKLKKKDILYMDESFLDSYSSYTHNELQILYRVFKQAQMENSLKVSLSLQFFQNLFHYEKESLVDVICRLIATAPTRPFFIGGFDHRKIVYLIRSGYMNKAEGDITIELSDEARNLFFEIKQPALLNLQYVQKFIKYKDRYSDEIKLYEFLANEYNRYFDKGYMYIPMDLRDMFFRCSTFDWQDKKYMEWYLEKMDILDLSIKATEEKGYKSKRYMWFVYSRSFIAKGIEQINKWTDIFVEGYAPVRKGVQVTGVIFKVKRNNKIKSADYYPKELKRVLSEDDKVFYEKCQSIYEKNLRITER